MQIVLPTRDTQLGLTWTNFIYTWQYGEQSIQCLDHCILLFFTMGKKKPQTHKAQ